MRLSMIGLCGAFVLLFPRALMAETGVSTPTPFYVVNMQRILDESIAGKAARNNIKAEVQKHQAKLDLLKRELDGLKEDLGKQSALLSAEAMDDKREQVARKERDFQRSVSEEQDAVGQFNDEQISKIVREAESTVHTLAEKNSYKFVLVRDDTLVIYVNKDFDLTDTVIKSLDAKTLG